MQEIEGIVLECLEHGFAEHEQHIQCRAVSYVLGTAGDPKLTSRCSLTKNWHTH